MNQFNKREDLLEKLKASSKENGLKDTFKTIRGHFKIEAIDKDGNVIDSHEDHNMIMNTARITMAKLIAGKSEHNLHISKFVMGTEGHVGSSIFTPKREIHGFIPSRSDLFSEPSTDQPNEKGETQRGIKYDYIRFDPRTTDESGNAAILEDGLGSNNKNTHSKVNITITGEDYDEPVVTYTIEVAQDAFNGKADDKGVVYTECGLYNERNEIFAMKTFPGKIKEKTVGFKIIWSIIF